MPADSIRFLVCQRTMPETLRKRLTASEIVTDDPAEELPVGSALQFSSALFAGNPPNGLNAIANWEFFRGALVALHFGDAAGQHILGSGVVIAPGVVIAARHVLEAEENRLRNGTCELICTGISDDGMSIWKCHRVTLVGNTDIALLMVRRASALSPVLTQATLTTRMPRVGEHITVAGIRHHAATPVRMDAEISISSMVGHGVVTARYERARDKVLLPFPCFEVDCPAAGGMSGGPAFDERGFLIGIVSSSFECALGGPTYLSLLWPALVEPISPEWPKGFYRGSTSLLAMDRRICGIERPDAIEVTNAAGKAIATYRHWE